MPVHWPRIVWVISFGLALIPAAWMLVYDFGWVTALSVAVVIWIVGPILIWQSYAAFILWRFYRGALKDFRK